jgi:hypothetical protein
MILIVFLCCVEGPKKVAIILHYDATVLVVLMSNIRTNKLPKKMLQLTPLHRLASMENLLMLRQLRIILRQVMRRTAMLITGVFSTPTCLDHM